MTLRRTSLVVHLGALSRTASNELDVAQVQDGGQDAEHGSLLLVADAAGGHGGLSVLELLGVAHTLDHVAAALVQVLVLLRALEVQGRSLSRRHTSEQLVEDVEVALARRLANNARLFEQVCAPTLLYE